MTQAGGNGGGIMYVHAFGCISFLDGVVLASSGEPGGDSAQDSECGGGGGEPA